MKKKGKFNRFLSFALAAVMVVQQANAVTIAEEWKTDVISESPESQNELEDGTSLAAISEDPGAAGLLEEVIPDVEKEHGDEIETSEEVTMNGKEEGIENETPEGETPDVGNQNK